MKQLDWKCAAKLCELPGEYTIYAGIREDWFWTSDLIAENGKRLKNSAYVASTWGTPALQISANGKMIFVDCDIEGEDPKMPDWWPEC